MIKVKYIKFLLSILGQMEIYFEYSRSQQLKLMFQSFIQSPQRSIHSKESQQKHFGLNLSQMTEISIKTNNEEFPYISIYRPNVKREQRRVQSLTILEKAFKHISFVKISQAFGKITQLKHTQKNTLIKMSNLSQIINKIKKKIQLRALWSILFAKSMKKNMSIGVKSINNVFSKVQKENLFASFTNLKISNLSRLIHNLSDESELAGLNSSLRLELTKLKQGCLSQQFINKSKAFQKMISHESLFSALQTNTFQQTVRMELKRFEEIRSKSTPRRKQLYENQLCLTVTSNIYKASLAAKHKYQQEEVQLKKQLLSYQDTDGIQQLQQIIAEKDSKIIAMDNAVTDISRMNNELKKYIADKDPSKIMPIIISQQKKIELKVKNIQGSVSRMYKERAILTSAINSCLQKAAESLQSERSQTNDVIGMMGDIPKIQTYLKKVKDNQFLKNTAEAILKYNRTNYDLQRQVEDLRSKIDLQENSLVNILDFVHENEKRIDQHQNILESITTPIIPNMEPLLISIVRIIKGSNQKQSRFSEKMEIKQKEPKDICRTPPSKNLVNFEIEQSQISLAEKFLSPLQRMKRIQKDEIDEHVLQQQVQVNQLKQNKDSQQEDIKFTDKLMKEKDDVICELEKKYSDLTKYCQQIEAQYAHLQKEMIENNQQKLDLQQNISNLIEKNTTLIQELNQFQKINTQLRGSRQQISQNLQKASQSSKQSQENPSISMQSELALIKQTQLMNQILTIKIQAETNKMSQFKELNALKSEIGSYQTLIDKLETELNNKQADIGEQKLNVRRLEENCNELRQINDDLKYKLMILEQKMGQEQTKQMEQNGYVLERMQSECTDLSRQLRTLISKLQEKDREVFQLQSQAKSDQLTFYSLRKQNEDLNNELYQLQNRYQQSQKCNFELKHEINQFKNQFYSLQMQLHNQQINKSHSIEKFQSMKRQLKQKQLVIENLMTQSKEFNSSLTSQLYISKEQQAKKQREYEEKFSQKDSLINQYQYELNSRENTIKSLEQLIIIYDTTKKSKNEDKESGIREKQIQFLHEQINSLQQFLNQITIQHHQLEIKYQQEKYRTARFNNDLQSSPNDKNYSKQHLTKENSYQINAIDYSFKRPSLQTQNYVQVIQSIDNFKIDANVGQELKKLIINNENLVDAVKTLRSEKEELLEDSKRLLQPQWVSELMFNLLLKIGKLKAQTAEGNQLWCDLCELMSNNSGQQLFAHLERYSIDFIGRI